MRPSCRARVSEYTARLRSCSLARAAHGDGGPRCGWYPLHGPTEYPLHAPLQYPLHCPGSRGVGFRVIMESGGAEGRCKGACREACKGCCSGAMHLLTREGGAAAARPAARAAATLPRKGASMVTPLWRPGRRRVGGQGSMVDPACLGLLGGVQWVVQGVPIKGCCSTPCTPLATHLKRRGVYTTPCSTLLSDPLDTPLPRWGLHYPLQYPLSGPLDTPTP